MKQFSFSTTPKIVFQTPVDEALLDFCVRQKITRVLLITDKQLVSLGLLDNSLTTLSNNDIACSVFDEVEADPSDVTIKNAAKL